MMSPISPQPSRPGEREECKSDAIKQETFVRMLLLPSCENKEKFFIQHQKRRGMEKYCLVTVNMSRERLTLFSGEGEPREGPQMISILIFSRPKRTGKRRRPPHHQPENLSPRLPWLEISDSGRSH